MILRNPVSKMILLIRLLLALTPLLLNAQSYLWPTNASRHLSSSFCEYRPRHYHSAIDIKTWNKEGYPIYAVEDGRVVRVRVSPFGYGKVLYVRLRDGRTAVYAHLQRFNKKLEQSVRRLQLKKKRYTVQWYPKNWPVKKGEILGYTGQTGIGVPHLHFEIRDAQEHPLQPLAFYPDYEDAVAPTLQSLLVIPLNDAASVNQSRLPQAFGLKKIKTGIYVLNDTIRAHGMIGLAVRGYDRSNGVSNKLGFYRSALFADDALLFSMRYDTLDFALTNQVDVDVYYPRRRTTGQRFNKLFIDDFNALPFYRESPGDGRLQIADRPLDFRVEVSDYRGNTSIIRGTIAPEERAGRPALTLLDLSDHAAYIQLRLPKDVKEIRFFTQNDSGLWIPVKYFDLLGRSSEQSGENMLVKLKLNSPSDYLLRLDIENAQNESMYALLSHNRKPHTTLDFDYTEHYLIVRLRPFFSNENQPVRISCGAIDTLLTPLARNGSAELALGMRWFAGDSLRLRIANDGYDYFDTTLTFYRFEPGKKMRKRLSSYVRMETAPKTLLDTVIVYWREEPLPDTTEAPLFSPPFRMDFAGPVFNKRARLFVAYDALTVPARRVGLYAMNKKGRLSPAGGRADTINSVIEAGIRSPGVYVVAADTVAPLLELLHPRDGEHLKRLPAVKFKTLDELSGIDSDADLHIRIDDHFVIPEWDPETDTVTGRPHWQLEPGLHRLRVWVDDAAGNRSQKQIRFFIKK